MIQVSVRRQNVVGMLAGIFSTVGTAAAQLPPGFRVRTVTAGLNAPVAMAHAADGRLFVTEKSGTIRVIVNDRLLDQPFAQLEVYDVNENGLVGITVDPDFERNGFVYVFAGISPTEQRIIRFTDQDNVGVDPLVIRDHLPGSPSVHVGGGLKIGPDRKMYFSIGDVGQPSLSQDLRWLSGKLCRINLDGTPCDDNPFTTPTGTPRAVFALGFRNPFRFCFAPDGRAFVLDVGSSREKRREEINIVRPGDNCGWPIVEGIQHSDENPDFVLPIFAYHEQGAAPTGPVYYTGGQFPEEYRGNLFHLDFVLHRVFRVVLDGEKVARHELFLQTIGGPVDMLQASDGSLVFCEHFTGRVRRISYPAGDALVAEPILPCGLGALGGILSLLAVFSFHRHASGRRPWPPSSM